MSAENKKIINSIRKEMLSGADPISLLEESFTNYTALVVSAGPSSVRWKEVYSQLSNSQENVILVAVKQAVELVGDLCDFHFINTVNLKKYRSAEDCFVVYTKNSSMDPAPCKRDLTFEIMDRLDRNLFFLSLTGNYEVYELKYTGPYRPPGPGIMHESVFFTLAHLGVSKIVTVGWDVADSNGMNSHYYDKYHAANRGPIFPIIKNVCTKLGLLAIARKMRAVFDCARFYMGFRINPSPMFAGEAEMVAKSIPGLRRWLEKKGVVLEIVSDSEWLRNV